VPLILVVGDKERDENTVSVRSMSGENIGTFTVDACVEMMKNKVQAYE